MYDLKLYGNSKKEAERLTNNVRIFYYYEVWHKQMCTCHAENTEAC